MTSRVKTFKKESLHVKQNVLHEEPTAAKAAPKSQSVNIHEG